MENFLASGGYEFFVGLPFCVLQITLCKCNANAGRGVKECAPVLYCISQMSRGGNFSARCKKSISLSS
jgi:hypothetical protein